MVSHELPMRVQPQPVAWPIIGQVNLGRYLVAALDHGRLPDVVLFAGPPHLGKTTAAVWLAQRQLCGSDGAKPCGTCTSCRQLLDHQHPNVTVVDPEGSTIGVEEVRTAMVTYTRSGWRGEMRWLILVDVERLTEAASSTMLKFLEELPPQLRLILTCADLDRLPATIQSRATTYFWNFVPSAEFRGTTRGTTASRDATERAAGRPGWYRQLAEPKAMDADRQHARETLQSFAQGTWPALASGTTRAERAAEQLGHEELVIRELLLTKLQAESRLLWPALHDEVVATADQLDLEQLVESSGRYLDRHFISPNIQPRLIYDDLHLV